MSSTIIVTNSYVDSLLDYLLFYQEDHHENYFTVPMFDYSKCKLFECTRCENWQTGVDVKKSGCKYI